MGMLHTKPETPTVQMTEISSSCQTCRTLCMKTTRNCWSNSFGHSHTRALWVYVARSIDASHA